jgi:four helix bundle protein
MIERVINETSFTFSIRMLHLYRILLKDKREFALTTKLFMSGYSIRDILKDAIEAKNHSDFMYQCAVAKKECNETIDLLELFFEKKYIEELQFKSIYKEAKELRKMIRNVIMVYKNKLY